MTTSQHEHTKDKVDSAQLIELLNEDLGANIRPSLPTWSTLR